MLIQLKAAIMDRSQPLSDAVLDWRYRTWRRQFIKEQYRLTRSCGYHPDYSEDVGNVDENEVDVDWQFSLPQEEITPQLRYLNEQFDRGEAYFESDFFRDRPEEAETTVEGATSPGEVDDVDMTEDDGDNDDNGDDGDDAEDEDAEEEDGGSESSGGWGENNCVCGQDPCVCGEE